MHIRGILGLGGESTYVRAQLERANRDILRYESIFITALALLALVFTLLPTAQWLGLADRELVVHRTFFVLIAIVSIVCHNVCVKLANSNEDTTRQTGGVLIAYTTALMILLTVLTVYNYAYRQSLYFYLMAVALIFGLLYINPLIAILINVLYTTILMVSIAALGQLDPAGIVALCSCCALASVIAVSNYHTRRRAMVASEAMLNMARHDALTHTKNRRAAEDDISQTIGHTTYLLISDIDNFKHYNDSYGHETGDGLLRSLARSMLNVFGEHHVYRYGGDEFMVLMTDLELEQFQNLIEEWRASFDGVEVEGGRLVPTTSGGFVYGTPRTSADLREMFRLADMRLYEAKQAGRNRVFSTAYASDQPADTTVDAS